MLLTKNHAACERAPRLAPKYDHTLLLPGLTFTRRTRARSATVFAKHKHGTPLRAARGRTRGAEAAAGECVCRGGAQSSRMSMSDV
jgi:hypothetical protein